MNLKRGAKAIAVRGISSSPGSRPLISKSVLRGLKMDYGPFPKTTNGRGMPPACISVDFDVTEPSRYEANRKGTLFILELADTYGIPITWAVCGKSVEDDLKSYSAILGASTRHEIGVHTYSHLDASTSSRDDFRSDIERCIRALGLDSPRAFVFPWNRESHFDVLKEIGFTVYRGKRRAVGIPLWNDGLWNVRPVYYLDQKSLGAESLIKAYIDLCLRNGAVFHLWSHPWSLVADGDTDRMAKTLGSVFSYLARLRKENKIALTTLGELTSSLNLIQEPVSQLGRSTPFRLDPTVTA